MFFLLLAVSNIFFADATEDFFNFLLEQQRRDDKQWEEKRELKLLEEKRYKDKVEDERRDLKRQDDARRDKERGRII